MRISLCWKVRQTVYHFKQKHLGGQSFWDVYCRIPLSRRLQGYILVFSVLSGLIYCQSCIWQAKQVNYQMHITALEQALEKEQQNVIAQQEVTAKLQISLEQNQAQLVAAAIPELDVESKTWIEEQTLCEEAPFNVPNEEDGCKSWNFTYMGYRSVTSKSSPQYKLLYGDTCYTDPSSGIRMVGDRYCIAVGTYYAPSIGTKLDLVMKNGSIIKCIVGDFKSDAHTDSTNRYHTGGMDRGIYYPGDGSVAEFIVDKAVFQNTDQYPKEASGSILKVVEIP